MAEEDGDVHELSAAADREDGGRVGAELTHIGRASLSPAILSWAGEQTFNCYQRSRQFISRHTQKSL